MKKMSLFALALSTGLAVFAQETQPQLRTPRPVVTHFGIRAGVNKADLRAKDLPAGSTFTEAQAKTSYNAGVFVNVPLGSSSFRFQPELNYSSQGGKLQGPSGTGGTTYEQDLHYLNVPLMFQWTKEGFFLETGPQAGFLLSAKAKSNSSSSSAESDNKNNFDKIDFSWGAGLGYVSRMGLGVDLRYNYGIANIIEDNTSGLNGTWKNSVGQFSLIYQFGPK